MVKNIRIYTINTCAYCVMVKKWLKVKGLEWEEVNVEENPDRAQEAFEVSGQLAVPVTVVTKDNDEQEVIIGYNLAKLAPAVA